MILMKICILSQYYDLRSVNILSNTFVNLDHEVVYLHWISRPNEEYFGSLQSNVHNQLQKNFEKKIKIVDVFSDIGSTKSYIFFRAIKSIKAFKLLYQKIRDLSPDVLLIGHPFHLPLGILYKKKFNSKLIMIFVKIFTIPVLLVIL